MPDVLVDFRHGEGPIDAADAVAIKPDYKDLPYFVEAATVAAADAPQVDRFVLSYSHDLDTTLGVRDVWFLLGDETAMPVPHAPPCPLFRTYGNRFYTPIRALPFDAHLVASEIALWARNELRADRLMAPRVLHSQWPQGEWLPLGTPGVDACTDDLPAIEQRPIDVGFRGSLGGGKRHAPRTIARRRMVEALRELPPHVAVDLLDTGSFHASYERDTTDYAQSLRDTKICLAPRGGSLETFRTFEAAASGCALITEPLPPAWFYTGLPRHEVTSWSQLPAIVDELLANRGLLRYLSQASRRWALEVVSAQAIGEWVARRLRELSR